MGTQKNRLNETVLLSTQNICLKLWVRKYLQFYAEFFCLSTEYFSYVYGSMGISMFVKTTCMILGVNN